LHRFGYRKDESEYVAVSASDAWTVHSGFGRRNYLIAADLLAAAWYIVAGVPLYIGSIDSDRIAVRVIYTTVLILAGLAHIIAAIVYKQKRRAFGALAAVLVGLLYGALINRACGSSSSDLILLPSSWVADQTRLLCDDGGCRSPDHRSGHVPHHQASLQQRS
jgi:hypothetical protein